MTTVARSLDVVVIGAGVAGLMLTWKLSSLGLRTLLVERDAHVAGGASSRNEGWLHNGTYHSVSIPDETTAVQVARRCSYGHASIRAFAPEAVDDVDNLSFALAGTSAMAELAVRRWQAAAIPFEHVSKDFLLQMEPTLQIDRVAEVFRVFDVAIDTRTLYRKLLVQAQQNGATVVCSATVKLLSPPSTRISITVNGHGKQVDARLILYTAGYSMTAMLEAQLGVRLPVRFWKSHLIVMRRQIRSGVFFLDPRKAAIMHHGDATIAGLNEDAERVEHPSFSADASGVSNVLRAVRELLPNAPDEHLGVGCIKVDVANTAEGADARSLNVFACEPVPRHIVVLPGKMTESPYITDIVTHEVASRLHDTRVSLRPMDAWLSRARGE